MNRLSVLAAIAALVATGPSFANPICTLGSARAWSQMAPIGANIVRVKSGGRARMTDIRTDCQYRLFLDGADIYFDVGDYILGGINLLDDITPDFSRDDAVADLEQFGYSLKIAVIGADQQPGPFIDQPLASTPIKALILPGEPMVWQQHYFIAQLPEGDYVTVLTLTYAGEVVETDTVYLHVH